MKAHKNPAFLMWVKLQTDQTRIREKAGTLKIARRIIGTYKQIMVRVHRDERLLHMIELAMQSQAWRTRQPTFDPAVFFALYGDTGIRDWRSVGVLVEPRLYQPGTFVARFYEIQYRRNSNKAEIQSFVNANNYFRYWYQAHCLRYDKFGYRI